MRKNGDMRKAKGNKKDEFYTQYDNIFDEMTYYKDEFKGAVVACPCDDYELSNFCKFFEDIREEWGIKKLIFTSYPDGKYRIIDDNEVKDGILDGNGDYRSDEVQELIKDSDIIVTNPPFSLFKEFIIWVVNSGKRFSILGQGVSIFVKEIFELYKKNLIWFGKHRNIAMTFQVPDDYDTKIVIDDKKYCKVACSWWTNFRNGQEKEKPFDTGVSYNPNNYRKYDNFDALHVKTRNDVPMDYDGLMGVSASYLDVRDDDVFEIVGLFNNYKETDVEKGWYVGEKQKVDVGTKIISFGGPIMDGKALFGRILIKKK